MVKSMRKNNRKIGQKQGKNKDQGKVREIRDPWISPYQVPARLNQARNGVANFPQIRHPSEARPGLLESVGRSPDNILL